ncbi:hypothetical protein NH340_JMT04257 [Sarcoptes scabiei]|nr:hypothetical protein NH340_JMT04257 [Sarcoptes scabiei]
MINIIALNSDPSKGFGERERKWGISDQELVKFRCNEYKRKRFLFFFKLSTLDNNQSRNDCFFFASRLKIKIQQILFSIKQTRSKFTFIDSESILFSVFQDFETNLSFSSIKIDSIKHLKTDRKGEREK